MYQATKLSRPADTESEERRHKLYPLYGGFHNFLRPNASGD